MGDEYKCRQLRKMLECEEGPGVHYGANLSHGKDAMPIQIDAGGLRALLAYYEVHAGNLGDQNDGDANDDVNVDDDDDDMEDSSQSHIKFATFVSVWDDGDMILDSQCKVNTWTKKVFDIKPAAGASCVDILDEEYIVLDGEKFPVYPEDLYYSEDEASAFWY